MHHTSSGGSSTGLSPLLVSQRNSEHPFPQFQSEQSADWNNVLPTSRAIALHLSGYTRIRFFERWLELTRKAH
jgi:hypothetical protein